MEGSQTRHAAGTALDLDTVWRSFLAASLRMGPPALGPALAARVGGGAEPATDWAAAVGFPLLITWLLVHRP